MSGKTRCNLRSTIFLPLFLLLWGVTLSSSPSGGVHPPGPPEAGPGSPNHRHAKVMKYRFGEGNGEYRVFLPDDPRPPSAPVIVFLHGWTAVNPKVYGAWIAHIVQRGAIVIYPRYQADNRTPPTTFTANAVASVKEAIGWLTTAAPVRPDLERFAIVGHSAGGNIAANVAALSEAGQLPRPRALMVVQPGRSWNPSERFSIPLEDLGRVPADLLLLCVVGDRDRVVRDIDARRICQETTSVPPANKNLVVIHSDDHGSPPLIANHYSPAALDPAFDSGEKTMTGAKGRFLQRLRRRRRGQHPAAAPPDLEGRENASVDALDFYGYWKLFDALCDAAFYQGKNREYALGATPQQRFMGRWSDGTPVEELEVLPLSPEK